MLALLVSAVLRATVAVAAAKVSWGSGEVHDARYSLFLQTTPHRGTTTDLPASALKSDDLDSQRKKPREQAKKAKGKRKPHVLLILADDYGWNDVGYHTDPNTVGYHNSANPDGNPVANAAAGIMKTPTIDRLANEGMKLENYYVQPLCSPTRSTVMTGRYPSHTGIGPSVIVIYNPFGVPAKETMLPALLKDAGYATHMVGKWHLGACDNRYEPTYRGFDSFMGYLAGGEGYYNHRSDFRNGSSAGETPFCMGGAVANNYSSTLFAGEVSRIVRAHDPDTPMFMYLAFQSVHNPYEDPIDSGVPGTDVNETFPEIVNPTRRIYAGMVAALDAGVAEVENAYKAAGMWDDTVTIFSTDNGGISVGNNYPLRGMKVLLWEGGIRGVGWVRGSKDHPVPAGGHTMALMHSTDWLPTVCGLAGASTEGKTQPLDGYDQWDVISRGATNQRTTVFHNVPVGAAPVLIGNGSQGYGTSSCLSFVDNRTGACHPFGVTGGAIRKNEWKLLTTFPGQAPWEDSAPVGIEQYPPGGAYPNGTRVFTPVTNDTLPEMHQINATLGVFLFNLTADWTETHNLAATRPEVLHEMLELYSQYAATAVMPLTFRYGFKDPQSGNSLPRDSSPYGSPEPHCQGQFGGSPYCAYGHEFDCMVSGRRIATSSSQQPIGKWDTGATNGSACHSACSEHSGCKWWSLETTEDQRSGGRTSINTCLFFDAKPAELVDCQASAVAGAAAVAGGDVATRQQPRVSACAYGPEDCGYGTPAHDPFPAPIKPIAPPPAPCKTNSTQCVVDGHGLQGGDCCGVFTVEATDEACMLKCREYMSCKFWVRRGDTCHLKSSQGKAYSANGVQYGPRCCDGGTAGAPPKHDDAVGFNADGTYRVPSHWNLW